MKKVMALGFFALIPVMALGQAGGYIKEFYDARKLAATDPQGAEEGMRRSFRMAVAAGNGDYATAAGINVCHSMYQRGATVETGKFAAEVLEALAPMQVDGPHGDALRRAVLFGYVERGLLMEGKIGEGWRVNRVVAETLRGKKVEVGGDGPAITVADVLRLPKGLVDQGWRLVEREADYLELSGRAVEALAMLDEAAARLGDLGKVPAAGRFYPFKVLTARAELTDFLGYEEEAIRQQRELLKVPASDASMARSLGILEVNLQRNRSQWEGPSEEILAAARGAGERLTAMGAGRGVAQLLAKMQLDLEHSEKAMAVLLENALEQAEQGHLMQALYFERDLLVGRARHGEKKLDAEFVGLLEKARGQGNKLSEPNLYREYADYLLEDKRPAEACGMLAEALRLCRAFGWHLHEPPILTNLFQARLMEGDRRGAEAALAELTSWLERHPEAPLARRSAAATGRIIGLAQLGETAAAKELLEQARVEAGSLPAYRRKWLAPEMEEVVLKPRVAVAESTVAAGAPVLRVHPLEIGSVAGPVGVARTRFSVLNPGLVRLNGGWEVTGPGASYDAARGVLEFSAGEAAADVRIPQALAAGGEAFLAARIAGVEGVEMAQVRVGWSPAGRTGGPGSTWEVRWDEEATGRVVMDASRLEGNPFRAVSVFHELAVPVGEMSGVFFRLRSSVPLRFEYYEPVGGRLLGIDANGDGDFTDAGDLYFGGSTGVAAALVPVVALEAAAAVEVRIFSTEGGGPMLMKGGHRLQVEVWRDGGWVMEAEDELK